VNRPQPSENADAIFHDQSDARSHARHGGFPHRRIGTVPPEGTTGRPAVTTISTAIRFACFGLVASLLCVGLLIGSVQPGAAGEIAPTAVSTMPAQAQSTGPSARPAAPAGSSTQEICPTGMAGFGWG
jgi:hypothetical protein